MDGSIPKFVEAYRARNVPEAHVIRAALEQAGIEARIEGELLHGVSGEVPMWQASPVVLVDETRLADARAIIEQAKSRAEARAAEHGDSDDVTHCLACGHEMSATDVTCPACGWSFKDAE